MTARLSVIGFALMGGGVIGLFYTNALFSPSPIVIGLQAVAVLLMLSARITFGRRSFHAAATPTEGGLVQTGPYRYLRHPIYAAACLFVWPPAIAGAAILPIVCALAVSAGALVRILCEEALLMRQYPGYASYARATKRMIPYVF
jgi:protein-S-isoprenylcysteine O-methyltransferase Ste14